MPIYEFHCEKCEKDSEILVRTRSEKGTKCPHCGSVKLTKKLSVFASTGSSNASPKAADCSGNPKSCGVCCGGGPHRH